MGVRCEPIDLDVVVVGAGLSGIGLACHLNQIMPNLRYKIFERRSSVGGTWDLFRYPGVRSDSDMHTLGYDFKPWTADEAIADGPSILAYLEETAAENDLYEHIVFKQSVLSADWQGSNMCWSLIVRNEDGGIRLITTRFLLMCTGYYNYEQGHMPAFKNIQAFAGDVVHPQHWPSELNINDRSFLIIGSGATAVTLLPKLATTARHVTLLQRSPTYIASMPRIDRFGLWIRKRLPTHLAYGLIRRKNIAFQQLVYWTAQHFPKWLKKKLLERVHGAIGTRLFSEGHFVPQYDPWQQRLCVTPDGEFFEAIKQSNTTVLTDTINGFQHDGVVLTSGKKIRADVVITATGLNLSVLGDVSFSMDGVKIDPGQCFTYRGLAYSGMPNVFSIFGYINASWTLRADLMSKYICRVIKYMNDHGYSSVVPKLRDAELDMPKLPFISGFTPGYLNRAFEHLPKQGDRSPWQNLQNYGADKEQLLKAPINDGVLTFT